MSKVGTACGVALTLLAASAFAQNNKPIRTGTYYEDRAASSASSATLILTFALTPSDKFLNITRVSCVVAMMPSQVLAYAQIAIGTTSGSFDTGRVYTIPDTASVNSTSVNPSRYYSFAPQLLFKVGPGRYPSILLQTGNGTTPLSVAGNCTIIGDLSDD